MNRSCPNKKFSSRARDNEVLEKGNISFDNKLHCFMVKGTSGVLRVVTLFSQESCSCPSNGECYHLLAVRLSIGMTEKTTKFTSHNLTILKKNTHSRREKNVAERDLGLMIRNHSIKAATELNKIEYPIFFLI